MFLSVNIEQASGNGGLRVDPPRMEPRALLTEVTTGQCLTFSAPTKMRYPHQTLLLTLGRLPWRRYINAGLTLPPTGRIHRYYQPTG